jgi:hypothetical protein
MKYDNILALDPSGCYNEGKGTTGWCLYNANTKQIVATGSISALSYPCKEAFWDAHIELIKTFINDKTALVIEDYFIYASRASAQINSHMETPQVIGVMQHYCWRYGIPYHMQKASDVKTRWSDKILVHKNIIKPKGNGYVVAQTNKRINRHCKDAIRHAVHYATFKNKRS